MTEQEEREDDIAIAAEYVLGLLTPPEVAAFEARLAVDPEFANLVARWSDDMAGMAATVPEVAPPRGGEAALMRRLFPEEQRSWLSRLGVLPALLGGLAAALVLLVAVNLDVLGPGPEAGVAVARLASADGTLVLAAAVDPTDGVLRIEREGAAPLEGRAEELWLVIGDAAPVSLGLLPAGGEGTVTLDPGLLPLPEGAVLAVSDEPPGGSPGEGPSGAILASGPVTGA